MNRSASEDAAPRAAGWSRKPLFCLALSILLGLYAAWNGTQFRDLWPWLAAVSLMLAAGVALVRRARLVLACAAAAAGAAFLLFVTLPSFWGSTRYAGQMLYYEGRVCDVECYSSQTVLLLEDVSVGSVRSEMEAMGGRIRLEIRDPQWEYEVGDLLMFKGRGALACAKSWSGDRDEKLLSYARRVRLLLTLSEEELHRVDHREPVGLSAWVTRFRNSLAGRMDEAFTPQTAAFVKALVLGDTQSLAYATRKDFSRLGLSHLLALSGLHVSLVFSLIQALGRRMRLWAHPVRMASFAFLGFYLVIADFRVSLLRVVYMRLIERLADRECRRYDPVSALAAGFIFQLLLTPWVFADIGFQLSYLSTLALLLGQPMLEKLSKSRWRIFTPAAVTGFVTLGTWPYLAGMFSEFAPASLLGNLVFVPFMPLVLGAAMLWLILSAVLPLPVVHAAMEWIASSYLSGIHLFSEQVQLVPLILYAPFFALPYALGMMTLSGVWGKPRKAIRWAAGMAALLCAVLMLVPPPSPKGLQVLGEGEKCALVCLGYEEDCLVADEPIYGLKDWLRERNIRCLDRLILTGSMEDAIEVVQSLEGFPVTHVEWPGQRRDGALAIRTEKIVAGQGEILTHSCGEWNLTWYPAGLTEEKIRVHAIREDGKEVAVGCAPWELPVDENAGLMGVCRIDKE